uniref:inactive ubiquitin thioesterase OTULINL n=1 Tax=Jaculus jaculus TaxID=51337 RepID=UPI001E1B524C|nr:inactive ubiquitin thioesterase OTULINL [Jaculus jaculus]
MAHPAQRWGLSQTEAVRGHEPSEDMSRHLRRPAARVLASQGMHFSTRSTRAGVGSVHVKAPGLARVQRADHHHPGPRPAEPLASEGTLLIGRQRARPRPARAPGKRAGARGRRPTSDGATGRGCGCGRRAARMAAPRSPGRARARVPAAGSDQAHSWTLVPSQAMDTVWRVAQGAVVLLVSFLKVALCFFRRLHSYVRHWLKRWSGYLQGKFKKNLSVEAEVDLLSYCAREWKGGTPRAKMMRKAYEELFWRHHVKCIRQVKRDNYNALRSVLFQVFSQGLAFPSWMKEKDIVKLPEKLLFSQGCNWIQQYSFGPEKYTGPNVFGKLRKCVEFLKMQWAELSAIRDPRRRGGACGALFADAALERRLLEAVKFLVLYRVTEAHERASGGPFRRLFARESSADPLSFMINHLNAIGDTCGLEQIDMLILGSSLELKIKVFRLFRFNSSDFSVCYPEEALREWPEISLLTEDDRHYHIPVF